LFAQHKQELFTNLISSSHTEKYKGTPNDVRAMAATDTIASVSNRAENKNRIKQQLLCNTN
jgi:hypothetical protein